MHFRPQGSSLYAGRNREWAHGLYEHPEAVARGLQPPEGDRWFFEDPLRLQLLYEGFPRLWAPLLER
jgi:hypothetical protein